MKTMITALMSLLIGMSTISEAGIEKLVDATVRVRCGNASGTGTTYAIMNGKVYILTNSHVVADGGKLTVEIYRRGHKSTPIDATVIYQKRNDEVDAAVLSVPVSALGGYLPPVLKFATPDYQYKNGQSLVTCGCPQGGDPTLYYARLTKVDGANIYFIPPPHQGRSGSSMCSPDGDKIVGLLFARTSQEGQGEGLAIKIQVLHKYLNPNITSSKTEETYPPPSVPYELIPHLQPRLPFGGGCDGCDPGGGCLPFGGGCQPRPFGGGGLPFGGGRQPQPQPQQPFGGGGGGGGIWPTLPPDEPQQPVTPIQPQIPVPPAVPQLPPAVKPPVTPPVMPQLPAEKPQSEKVREFLDQHRTAVFILLAIMSFIVVMVPPALRKAKASLIKALKEELNK